MTMAPETLRSATAFEAAEDTSLALPSDNKLRSGPQRVLDQVHTIKRSKSKHGKNGSLSPSPTSSTAQNLSVFAEFGSFKFSPSRANGTFSRSNTNVSSGLSKGINFQKSRSLSTKSMGRRHVSTSSQWEQRFHSTTWPQPPNSLKPSRSDPALAPPLSPLAPAPAPVPAPVMRAKGQVMQSQQTLQTRVNRSSVYSMTNGTTNMTNSQTRIVRPPSSQSHNESKMSLIRTTKTELQSGVNSSVSMSDLTLKEAVEFLSHSEENYQQCGASFIQHATFKEDRPKQEVLALGGIPPLVSLLRSPNPRVSQSASAALRNLVFRDHANKLEVQQCSGIGKALQLLKETDSTETQKQLTGLLWNLSSADELKEELIFTALPVLTENVVVPFTCWSDSSANNNIHPEVFHSATGCLRNLSCAQKKERQAMRDCRGLIDSIMNYVQSCVVEDNPDDKSVENCACILHNLTYQLETESPECFAKYNTVTDGAAAGKKSPIIGCFSPKSGKVQKEFLFDATRDMPEDSAPTGVKWLCHPKAMHIYLSLLGSSQKDATLEACCGALQNLTANNVQGLPGSSAMSQILVQKLRALHYIPSLLKSPNSSLQKTAISLVGNLSSTSSLHTPMARQLLPELTSLLTSGTRAMGNSDDTIASTCNTIRVLLPADPEVSKKVLSSELVGSLADISENESFPKGSKAASLLLHNMWQEKNLQGPLKKLGLGKQLFVNDTTTAAFKSVHVIESD
ncbi:plakophilin-1 [Myripristis murdjan]|uniref:Plakophilin 1 n=1 Tax=Myripristis murdjan TaxID=586833 RepID=A0A667X8Q7_9TELE|nr:plakophilin-1 [Myripristis murdjan]